MTRTARCSRRRMSGRVPWVPPPPSLSQSFTSRGAARLTSVTFMPCFCNRHSLFMATIRLFFKLASHRSVSVKPPTVTEMTHPRRGKPHRLHQARGQREPQLRRLCCALVAERAPRLRLPSAVCAEHPGRPVSSTLSGALGSRSPTRAPDTDLARQSELAGLPGGFLPDHGLCLHTEQRNEKQCLSNIHCKKLDLNRLPLKGSI